MSHEKKLQLVNNILAAFAAAPKQAVPANPATTIAEKAQVIVSGVAVEVFHSKVSVAPWATEEYLTVSVPVLPELGGSMEIFRAEGVNSRWWKVRTSPLAWLLFEQGQQQQQPQQVKLEAAYA